MKYTVTEKNVLTALKSLGGVATPAAISRATGMPYSTVHLALKKLVGRGAVIRLYRGVYALRQQSATVERP